MCFSAIAVADFKKLQRRVPSRPDLPAFERLYEDRLESGVTIPRALDANFDEPQTPEERRIRELILEYRYRRTKDFEEKLFKQAKRKADAERLQEAARALQKQPTKKSAEDIRIATNKIARFKEQIKTENRAELGSQDGRFFPFNYAPVIVHEGGENLIRPMRYHCRPAGFPPSIDKERDGLYNARRNNIFRYWRNYFHLFGDTHALMVITGFYENVTLHDYEHRQLRPGEEEVNLVIGFNPQPALEMIVPCLWSRWEGDGQVLESFAAVTDEPPPEVAATGHDRCVIALQPDNVQRWLTPEGQDLAQLDAILGEQQPFYYEHRMAA